MLQHLAAEDDGLGQVKLEKLPTSHLVTWCQRRQRAGAGPYTVNMHMSKLGTAIRHTKSILNPRIGDPVGDARPTLAYPLPTLAALAPLFDRQRFGQTGFALDVFQQAGDVVNHILAMPQACRVSHIGLERDQNALQAPDFPGQGGTPLAWGFGRTARVCGPQTWGWAGDGRAWT